MPTSRGCNELSIESPSYREHPLSVGCGHCLEARCHLISQAKGLQCWENWTWCIAVPGSGLSVENQWDCGMEVTTVVSVSLAVGMWT